MNHPLIEICVEGIDEMIDAQDAGADRVELCASLMEGGLTPSLGTVRHALRLARIPVHVIVRPRGGDFLYSAHEFASMLLDVAALRDLGVAGVVAGCLMEDGTIDVARMTELVTIARPASVTCHRAFDMTRDPEAALEQLIDCDVDRVLTSGQEADAVAGSTLLRHLHTRAGGRIVVMGCGGLDASNIAAVRRDTGLTELHFAARAARPSAMAWRNTAVGMGGTVLEREYQVWETDAGAVRAAIAAARGTP